MKIGFVGLGIMGSAMAHNLVKAGFGLKVWNRSPASVEPLLAAGAGLAVTPREVAETSDIVCAMMANPAAVAAVRDGADGIVAGLAAGKGYIDLSTVDAATSRQSHELAGARGATFLEAPVAGSRKPAEDGTLTIMAAGDRELYDRVLPVLQAMGKKILFLGATGRAAEMKLANNLVMAGMLTALAEGLTLASRCGLDSAALLEVLDSGALANPMFRLKGPMMAENGSYPAAFPLQHMQKDLRLALQLAESAGLPLYQTALVNEMFREALAGGLGDRDFSAIGRVVSGRAGKP